MRYEEASVKTASQLRSIAHSQLIREVSSLSLPEIDDLVDGIARMIPAGNVPGMILNGLLRSHAPPPSPETTRRDINLIFRGLRQTLDKAIYGAFFAGPAAVLWGYQNLLKLAGKNPEEAFPNGIWQFYVEYALREDSARHANETLGFDAELARRGIRLSPVDRCTAWLMTAIRILHRYDAHLQNEWRERVYIHLLRQVTRDTPHAASSASLYRQWEEQRPYRRPDDAPRRQDYFTARRLAFDRFLEPVLDELPPSLRRQWLAAAQQAKDREAPAYRRQMSIVARLDPGPYGETIVPLSLEEVRVGLIHRGHYFLFPVQVAGQMPDVRDVRRKVAALMQTEPAPPAVSLLPLVRTPRARLPEILRRLDEPTQRALTDLQNAAILLNADPRPAPPPLAQIRGDAERGIGSHPLTILDTGQSFIFDQSHIFFDGIGGAALAEIMTNEAVEWALYLHTLPPPRPSAPPPRSLSFDRKGLPDAPAARPESCAENRAANLKAIHVLRRLLRRRNRMLDLKVNDLLVLYRAIHAATYRPSKTLQEALQGAARAGGPAGEAASAALKMLSAPAQRNPAILIPVDASRRSPRDRLYPVSFETPLRELNLLDLHRQAVRFLSAHPPHSADYARAYPRFQQIRRRYLAALAGFSAVMKHIKAIATAGETANIETAKLLAHLPVPLQRLLDRLPNQFDVLNDLIKGREVFSNVGQVAPTSTLTRFITAKDDNPKKSLAWGILTDARGEMCISLRDFRPPVVRLAAGGQHELAADITREYLDAYVEGLNRYVQDLYRIAVAARPTEGEA